MKEMLHWLPIMDGIEFNTFIVGKVSIEGAHGDLNCIVLFLPSLVDVVALSAPPHHNGAYLYFLEIGPSILTP